MTPANVFSGTLKRSLKVAVYLLEIEKSVPFCLPTLCSRLKLLWRCREANVAIVFALAVPALVGLTGLGVDSASFYNQQSRMQSVADATALAVGKEMKLYSEKLGPLEAAGVERAETLLREVGLAERPHSIDITFDEKDAKARVEITMEVNAFLPVDVWGETPIVVSAEAWVFGTAQLCVLSLRDRSKHVFKLDRARVTAPECAAQANSKHPKGLGAKAASLLLTSYTCTSGGYEGVGAAFHPLPETDCPILDDPLKERTPPTMGGCDFSDVEIKGGVRRISPGRYCGGLKIEKDAVVTAEPGVYIISGGKFEVKDEATLRGENLGFYFADDDATFEFTDEALVELSGADDGPMAGLLFFENPAAKSGRQFKISSDRVRQLVGTIYLPRGTLKASATEQGILPPPGAPLEVIGAASTYTIIVADKIELSGVNLVINSDYGASEVPVPGGLGPNSTQVQLTR